MERLIARCLLTLMLCLPASVIANEWEVSAGLAYSNGVRIGESIYEPGLLFNIDMAQPVAFGPDTGFYFHVSTSLERYYNRRPDIDNTAMDATTLGLGFTRQLVDGVTLAVAPGFSYQRYGSPIESRFKYNTRISARIGPPEDDFKILVTYDTALRAVGLSFTARLDYLLFRF